MHREGARYFVTELNFPIGFEKEKKKKIKYINTNTNPMDWYWYWYWYFYRRVYTLKKRFVFASTLLPTMHTESRV
jgi:hypothetical protein